MRDSGRSGDGLALPLTEGQAVSVLVAVGLHLLATGRPRQVVRPVDVVVGLGGRPRVIAGPCDATDDRGLLRLGRTLAPTGSRLASLVDAWARSGTELPELLRMLVALGGQPLTGGVRPPGGRPRQCG